MGLPPLPVSGVLANKSTAYWQDPIFIANDSYPDYKVFVLLALLLLLTAYTVWKENE